jgi:hypothetical protein
MILEKQKENLELNDGEIHESFATVIDFDSADFLKQMLSKFYSDAVGSLIRETTSNALDSHREINSSEPIVVSFHINDEGNYEFSVEDFGVGINKDTINNILRKYGKSTKRNSVNQLGAFGLGWKSPLAYTSGFYFTGRKDGIEIKCMMYEGEEDIKIDVLYEGTTKEKNGCKVTVPVKSSDKGDFIEKISEQLAYFENVYFNVKDLNNNFKIHREKDFQYSDLCTDHNLHICLDNVYYPIDFQKLGINPINIALGLRFSLTDGLFPVPNRESIKYTLETKEIILDKINKVANWAAEKYNETITDTKDIYKVMEHYNTSSRLLELTGGLSIDIRALVPYTDAKVLDDPNIEGLKVLSTKKMMDIQGDFLREYEKEYTLSNDRISQEKHWKQVNMGMFTKNSASLYLFSDRMTSLKKDYIKSLHPKSYASIYMVKEKEYFKLGSFRDDSLFHNTTFYNLLELKKIPKSKWRDAINDFYYVRDLITEGRLIDLDKMVIPQSFIDSRKKARAVVVSVRKMKQFGDVLGKTCVALEKYSHSKSTKLVSEIYKLDTIYKLPFTIVYGTLEEYEKLDKLFALSIANKITFVVFSERELKKVKEVNSHNLLSIEEFMKGEHKLFKRIVTAQLIHKLKVSQQYAFLKVGTLEHISLDLARKIETLESYRSQWYKSGGNEEMVLAMLALAETENLFDPEVYSMYQEVKKTLEKLYFLNSCLQAFSPQYAALDKNSVRVNTLVDLFKYHKEKVNLEHYTKPEVVEESVEEVLEAI